MVLLTKRGNELPSEAFELSKNEALKYQKNFIKNWPSQQDVFFINYGNQIAGASTFISSSLIFRYFKRTFKLRTSSRTIFTILPAIIIPTLSTPFLTDIMLTNKVLIMQLDCPVCQQLKFGLSHLYMGLVYPGVYCYISLSSIAYQFNSYNIPSLQTHPKEYWKTSVQILKKSGHLFKVVGLLQTAVLLLLPFLQNKELVNVVNKAKENYYFENLDNVGNLEDKL